MMSNTSNIDDVSGSNSLPSGLQLLLRKRFIAADEQVVDYLRYNMRSQIFAKSLPMPLVIGNLKRLELLQTQPELKDKLANYKIVCALSTVT